MLYIHTCNTTLVLAVVVAINTYIQEEASSPLALLLRQGSLGTSGLGVEGTH